MSELMPAIEAEVIRRSVTDYLTTTFALTDEVANHALEEFLTDPSRGIFKGPYVRTRLPFRGSDDEGFDFEFPLEHKPYGHQAKAFARLASFVDGEEVRPKPTMVTTGTGSGKTEAFLYPILNHVLRAKRQGKPGVKALILYPMNALANDQAQRLARTLVETPELEGIRAGIYTGQEGKKRTVVSKEGLINDRAVIREDPPDILLTNYKMLDQLLLRFEDGPLWEVSADSLQYLVLDEFHTYDGAQGTDVAMLLRRLGMTLRHYQDPTGLGPKDQERPLGPVTPVATSATLGTGNLQQMREFAETVFGEPFGEDAVIGETRMTLQEWVDGAPEELEGLGLEPVPVAEVTVDAYAGALAAMGDRPDSQALLELTLRHLFRKAGSAQDVVGKDAGVDGNEFDVLEVLHNPELQDLALRAHPLVQDLVQVTASTQPIGDLPEMFLPPSTTRGRMWRHNKVLWDAFFRGFVASLGVMRALRGRDFISTEVHFWIRELSRIDRSAEASPEFSWTDDGRVDVEAGEDRPKYPAIYCRRCGRSGWMVSLGPVGEDQGTDDSEIRKSSATGTGRVRALIHAPKEGAVVLRDGDDVERVRWWNVKDRTFTDVVPDDGSEDYLEGWVIPVLMHVGSDADKGSANDVCPACDYHDGVRFLGSAIATLVSVSLSTLFAAQNLDDQEKRALVFADSVQDAAHRAGFVQARAHSMTLRAILTEALGESEMTLDELVAAAIDQAGDDPVDRYRLLPPDIAEWEAFKPFWDTDGVTASAARRVRDRVRTRLEFDTAMEFGTFSKVGRTLEMTGTVSAHVEAGDPELLDRLAEAALVKAGWQDTLDDVGEEEARKRRVQWVRGVLEHIRTQGAIEHQWLNKYLNEDGARYFIWGGRKRGDGMPAFPAGRSAPAFPRVGGKAGKSELESVSSPKGWHGAWAGKVLGVPARDGARLAGVLLEQLAGAGQLKSHSTTSGGVAYSIPSNSVVLRAISTEELHGGKVLLECDVCSTLVPGSTETVSVLEGAPCTSLRCSGRLHPKEAPEGFYRRMYRSASMRRVVAREHTGLLDDETRVTYEDQFKAGSEDPSAPNVLVATPTLEMGIDIGDLSAVYLSSIPKTVASYTQRVGRAGRLNGNALAVTYARGRGKDLPKALSPLSVIEGDVAPPATYVDAEEILRRQFTAAIMDSFARDPHRPHPRRAPQVMGSFSPESFLGQVVEVAESKDEFLEMFQRIFVGVDEQSFKKLEAWITPQSGPFTSEYAAFMAAQSQLWNQEVKELNYRLAELDKEVAALQKAAEAPSATDEDKKALRGAEASKKMSLGRRGKLQGEYWIAVLEEFGILPNYTLLDDSTSLGVGVSQRNPETGEREALSLEVDRPSRHAVREFAPGSTFYTRGLEITIDAVDLGPDAEAIRTWVLCGDCGFGQDVGMTVGDLPLSCPRCGSGSINDVGQRFDLIELRRATAEISRDEASISDRRDDRATRRFVTIPTVDLDPDRRQVQWGETGSGLGVAYYDNVTVRQLNLGTEGRGRSLSIAGDEMAPSLFTLCEGCGKQQRVDGGAFQFRHRPWCKYRNDIEPHERSVALTHTLETQGLVLYLPSDVTMAGSFAVPPLVAALHIGLREVLGGDPEHLDVVLANVPDPQGHGVREALVLHDRIPGGTGYLTEWASPEQLHRILANAYEVVANCECTGDERIACDSCLLPYARPDLVNTVSRAAAARHLETLLRISEADLEEAGDSSPTPDFSDWQIQEGNVPGHDVGESHLEHRFRKVLQERLEGMGAGVTESVERGFTTLTIERIGGRGRRWSLKSQVMMEGTVPDFVLESNDFNIPKIAIYTDGYQFHATQAKNRLADDAQKRARLRDSGIGVLAVTSRDLDGAEAKESSDPFIPLGLREQIINTPHMGSTRDAFERQGINPVDWLLRWIQAPTVEDIRKAARGLPLTFHGHSGLMKKALPKETLEQTTSRLVVAQSAHDTDALASAASGPAIWLGDRIGVGIEPVQGGLAMAVVIDDRDGNLADRETWEEWLRISNAAIFRSQPTQITAVSLVRALGEQDVVDAGVFMGAAEVSEGWSKLIEDALDEDEAELLTVLGTAGIKTLPELGAEAGDGIPVDVAWPNFKVALAVPSMEKADRQALKEAGWKLLDAGIDGLAERVQAAGIR